MNKSKKVVKIILIILVLIVLIIGMLYIFNPTTKLINNLNKITGTSYDLEKNNRTVAYNGRCKVAVYPTEHLIELNLVQDDKNEHLIYLSVGDSKAKKSGYISVSIVSTGEQKEIVEKMNETSDIKEPKVSKEYNAFNYFIYNGKNYYYNLNEAGGIMFTTPINEKYLYWVMVANYKDLSREDIESILYFEVL